MKVTINNKDLDVVLATNFFQKLKGFMFLKNINHVLRLKTNSIHTFFMKDEIDIVMTDKNNKIIYIFPNVKKNKIIIKKNIYYIYEFPKNTTSYLKINEILVIK